MVVLLTVAVTLVAVIEETSQTKVLIGVSQALALTLITTDRHNEGEGRISTICNGLHPDLAAVKGNIVLTLQLPMAHKPPTGHNLT
jgi:hypothetical protein